ncbi:D-glycerate dehydrogenase [Neobacillus cucumis]|uniref:2-hydroxyacid dehydrogenase n=1 Tax=Neobacillus cucumis TaxID=1740721 RepID=UPI002E1BE02A|nr:D-glycerate dehydrogenase [Neobacillus cucumis]
MKDKIVVYRKLPNDLLNYLQNHFEVRYFPNLDEHSYTQFLNELTDAHGLLGASLKIDQEILNLAPNLKIISNISVGYDNLDLPELKRRGILATNTPGVLTETTADAVFSLVLATARRIPELDHFVRSGNWSASIEEELFGVDVHHKTIGIIGMGGIGQEVAKRAHLGFDMQVLYHSRTRKQEVEEKLGATYCSLDELLSQSHFVCVMTPYTPETDKLIRERELQLMRSDAILINGSRGKNIDEGALIKALKQKWILGAGLDVYEVEPIKEDNPLLTLQNVVTLPHIGSATKETRYKMAKLAIENIEKGLNGQTPPNLIK